MEPTFASFQDERQFYQQRIADLESQLAQRDARIADLEQKVAFLTEQVAKLSKNSSNSSKPPSSDIVNPPKSGPSDGQPRKQGGQPGHNGAHRQPFSLDQIDEVYEDIPDHCPKGHDLSGQPLLEPRIHQQAERVEKPVKITEHRRYAKRCPICDQIVYADLSEGVAGDPLFGPRLTALAAYMKGALHTTYSGLEDFSRDVLGLTISRSLLCNMIARVSATLQPAYDELGEHVPTAPVLNIDESGWKDNGVKYWLWIFATNTISLFVLARSRSSKVLYEVLGATWSGTIVSDFFSAYVKYANTLQQFCLAHLIRDIKFLTTLPDPMEQAFGTLLLSQFRRLFHLWHRRDKIPKERFDPLMQKIQNRIFVLAQRENLPKHSRRLARRIRKHGGALFRFLFDPLVSPTNNLAEQSIRHSVLNQRLTQGSRSEMGRRWNERIFTVVGTCRKQGRSAWQFLCDTVSAHYCHMPMPSLIPQTY